MEKISIDKIKGNPTEAVHETHNLKFYGMSLAKKINL